MPTHTTATVSAADASRGNEAIQQHIDAVAERGGGTVAVPSARYQIHDALRLRSGVTLVGEPGAVLVLPQSAGCALKEFMGCGLYEFVPELPELFEVGMGVRLSDDQAHGFYQTVAGIVARDGNRFFIDRPAHHDYNPNRHARATHIFPAIEGRGVQDVTVRGLTIDGSAEQHDRLNGCRGGGVILLGCRRVTIDQVEVRHYPGDAVSFQQCVDVTVGHCHLHHNRGHGLHPGSGSVRYRMHHTRVHDNGGDGLFYCLRTTHSCCEENELCDNGGDGISIGERDTDHLIRRNVIRGNAGVAVRFRSSIATGGERVHVVENQISPNTCRQGEHEVVVLAALRHVFIQDNMFTPSATPVLRAEASPAEVCFVGNVVTGRPQEPGDVVAPPDAVRFSEPAAFPPIGPEAATDRDLRHLGCAAG